MLLAAFVCGTVGQMRMKRTHLAAALGVGLAGFAYLSIGQMRMHRTHLAAALGVGFGLVWLHNDCFDSGCFTGLRSPAYTSSLPLTQEDGLPQ